MSVSSHPMAGLVDHSSASNKHSVSFLTRESRREDEVVIGSAVDEVGATVRVVQSGRAAFLRLRERHTGREQGGIKDQTTRHVEERAPEYHRHTLLGTTICSKGRIGC